jgi:dipeptidyl aminopeptidase/acylaminoacyl peptidase
MKAPCGTWNSPITAELIASQTIGFSEVVLDGDDIYWLESRPSEKGRMVIVKRDPGGQVSDQLSPPFSARTRVHEYGGGAYTVFSGTIYFSNLSDGRIYRQNPGSRPCPLTPEGNFRYADLTYDRHRNRLLCVREDHTGSDQFPVNTLISVDPRDSRDVRIIVSGGDFYSNPRISPDGNSLAFLTWNLPDMPWDGTGLRVARLNEEGVPDSSRLVAGGREESVFQPEWSPDGRLYYVSDLSGWWNIYRASPAGPEPICQMEAEFGLPQWVFGMSTYGFIAADIIICAYARAGIWHLAEIRPVEPAVFLEIEAPFTDIAGIRARPGKVVFLGASTTVPPSIIRYEPQPRMFEALRTESEITVDRGYLSLPEAIRFPTGDEVNSHGFFYPPRNPDYSLPDGELPPLIVITHSGPTGAAANALRLKIQFWTSRGFAVLDVNYRGSTGFGRDYRRRLEGQWGVADVEDCVSGARYLVQRGDVDGERLIIRGSSAGGFTTLCALTFSDLFKAGASYYGISELDSLARDTHKFESRYCDRLIGPYPERRDLYLARSPINSVDRLSCPVIFFQGLEDRVVPPEQAEMMIAALRKKGIPTASIFFEGESHGFRQADTVQRSLTAELEFYLTRVCR